MGHVIAGETSQQAVLREMSEEIGIQLSGDDIQLISRFFWDKINHIVDVWVVHKDIEVNTAVLQQGEVSEIKYITKDELITLIGDGSVDRPSRPSEYIELIRTLE